ncbi:MAG: phosphotransferase [Alphaproteobacteria bacterium]|nr:phosphotransferase [Alphaproteobacteria bacterium]
MPRKRSGFPSRGGSPRSARFPVRGRFGRAWRADTPVPTCFQDTCRRVERRYGAGVQIEDHLRRVTGARAAHRVARIQSLWSGWGEIVRFALDGAAVPSVVVKIVEPAASHPLGWGSGVAEARKHRSYAVEEAWYREWGSRCPVRIPTALDVAQGVFVLEDLDAAGFPERARGGGRLPDARVAACITWLARFHAGFLGASPDGLWPDGTYWHLETRPDELAAMPEGALKRAAGPIDARLRGATHRTVVHGDAKVANFCFGPSGVAAVDFQYVGGGVGVQDLAYFLGSAFDDAQLEHVAERWVDAYFDALRGAGGGAAEAEWRALLPFAWADFERFLAGWAPEHWKRGGYADARTQEALDALGVTGS